MRQLVYIFALVLVATSATHSHAAIYKWVEDNGTVTFRDTPPPPGKQATIIEPQPAALEYSKPFDAGEVLGELKEKAADTVSTVGDKVESIKTMAEGQVETLKTQRLILPDPDEYEKQLGLR